MHEIKNCFWTATRLFIFLLLQLIVSCEKFLEVAPPTTQILGELVFSGDAAATGAVSGMYVDLYSQSSFAGGSNLGIVSLAGLSADELHNYPANDLQFKNFEHNNLSSDNSNIFSLWSSMFKGIYEANSILERLTNSNAVSPMLSNHLKGEALFVRAFCNFYLVNCFGDVPLVLTTNYKTNASIPRTSADKVYQQIETDLLESESLLSENYISEGKARPNKYTATAMLARYYLYIRDWSRAEQKATNVISKNALYRLPGNLDSVFIAKSVEAIWQLQPPDEITYTNEGYFFSKTSAFDNQILNSSVITYFEVNDKRRANWIDSISLTQFLPFKYKRFNTLGSQDIEYSMVLRLAEQYLIRAEARAALNNISAAVDDVDIIRNRAGLPLLKNTNPNISRENILLAIDQERKIEFLAEWGHRWFDLKRRGLATQILGNLKPGWTVNDELYPIPGQELTRNPMLEPQNKGY